MMSVSVKQKYQATKLEAMLPYMAHVAGMDSPDDAAYLFWMVQNLLQQKTADKKSAVVVEVGSYCGRLSMPLACAFLEEEEHSLILTDDFRGFYGKNPDSLDIFSRRFQECETRSGIDLHAHLTYALHFHGFEGQEVIRGDMKKTPESWEMISQGQKRDPEIDLLIFNNIGNYKAFLDISNGWLKWLRQGHAAVFCGAEKDYVQAVIKELSVVKKWKMLMQRISGGRAMIVIGRPQDETSGEA